MFIFQANQMDINILWLENDYCQRPTKSPVTIKLIQMYVKYSCVVVSVTRLSERPFRIVYSTQSGLNHLFIYISR